MKYQIGNIYSDGMHYMSGEGAVKRICYFSPFVNIHRTELRITLTSFIHTRTYTHQHKHEHTLSFPKLRTLF